MWGSNQVCIKLVIGIGPVSIHVTHHTGSHGWHLDHVRTEFREGLIMLKNRTVIRYLNFRMISLDMTNGGND